ELVEIGGEREDGFAGETRHHDDPGRGEIEGQVLENAKGLSAAFVQMIDPGGGAGKHVVEIFRVEANALGFAGSSGSVDDGDEVFALAGIERAASSLLQRYGLEDLVERG